MWSSVWLRLGHVAVGNTNKHLTKFNVQVRCFTSQSQPAYTLPTISEERKVEEQGVW